ncbi:MAG: DUF805 domain-containing protein [Oscillospiraceae bacterium]|nr:DUF805 domain-containing protein [Oscillospiraceae bacterium]
MGFKEAVQSCLSQYATFSGRARRSEYWYFSLFNALLGFVIGVIGGLFLGETLTNVLTALVTLALLAPGLAVSVRRLHDIGKSGWALLFALIPVVGWILIIVWACKDSESGENQYGSNPKETNALYQ